MALTHGPNDSLPPLCSGAKIKLLIRGSQYFPLLSHQMALTSSQKHADTFLPLNLGGIRQGVKSLEGLLG